MTHTVILTAGQTKTITKSSRVKAISMTARGVGVSATYTGGSRFQHANSAAIPLVQNEPVSIVGNPVECVITCVSGTVDLLLDF